MSKGARKNPVGAKFAMIARYVLEYNDRLAVLAAELEDQVMLVRMEALDQAEEQRRVFNFAGASGRLLTKRLNVHSVADARRPEFKF